MKKNILFCLFVSFFVLSFTGCFFVNVDLNEKYTMKFSNESSYNVSDWYLKDSDGNNHVKTHNNFYPVYAGCENSISNLPCDNYFIYFSFTPNPKITDYWRSSSHVYVNRNKVYVLKNWFNNQVTDSFYNRSATEIPDINNVDNEEKIFLVDEDGNVIEFVKVGE